MMEVTDLSICRLVRSYARRLPQGFNGDEWTGAAIMLPAPKGLLAESGALSGTPIATL